MIYLIYFGAAPIARIYGMESAYEVYHKACELAELTGDECMLVIEEDGEVIADTEWEE